MGGGREGLNIQYLYESHETNPQVYPHSTDLGTGVACLCPNSPQPRERPKSLWNASAPSLYLQVNKKKSRESPESPGLGRVRRGQERSCKEAEGYRAFESKSLLWARE